MILGGVIKSSARNPLLTILLVAGLAVWGWLSLVRATALKKLVLAPKPG